MAAQPGIPILDGFPDVEAGYVALEVMNAATNTEPDFVNGRFLVMDPQTFALQVVTSYPSQLPAASWRVAISMEDEGDNTGPSVTLWSTAATFGETEYQWRVAALDLATGTFKGVIKMLIDSAPPKNTVADWHLVDAYAQNPDASFLMQDTLVV